MAYRELPSVVPGSRLHLAVLDFYLTQEWYTVAQQAGQTNALPFNLNRSTAHHILSGTMPHTLRKQLLLLKRALFNSVLSFSSKQVMMNHPISWCFWITQPTKSSCLEGLAENLMIPYTPHGITTCFGTALLMIWWLTEIQGTFCLPA